MRYLILSIALLAAPALAGPHINVFHACGLLIITEYDGPAGSDVLTREVWLQSQTARDSLDAAIKLAEPEDMMKIDLTGLLRKLYGFKCPNST